jgi:hypothetical protein
MVKAGKGVIMFRWITGAIESATEIGKELIDTPLEKAEAQSLKLKVLDPNGKMRRELSRAVTRMYSVYILLTMILVLCQAFELGEAKQLALAVSSMKELFLPITGLFGAIVTSSFGVNAYNVNKGK